jgi:hypothetical protein
MEIRLATEHDIPAIMALEAKYFVGNLDEVEQTQGFISVLHTREWFQWAVDCDGVHIAVSDAHGVVGFIGVTPPPTRSDPAPSKIIGTMVDLADTLKFHGRRVSDHRYALRGPVLLDRAARGQGLYSAFNSVTRKVYADRYDLGVIFVSVDNPVSLHTTTTKLGAESVAIFEVDANRYHFMVFGY